MIDYLCIALICRMTILVVMMLITAHQLYPKKDVVLSAPLTKRYYFIAALLKDNEKIMMNWNSELLKFIEIIGYDYIFVSIIENGDSMDHTREYLKNLKYILKSKNINNNIIITKLFKRYDQDRVAWLASLRNEAIKPLKSLDWDYNNTRIIFLNDIWFQYIDLINLINSNNGIYDMVCGMDFYYSFYDDWVTRDINGKHLNRIYPYFHDKKSLKNLFSIQYHHHQQQLQHHYDNNTTTAIHVFSCWNGVAIMLASPFIHDQIRFRVSYSNQTHHSECFWLCYDFWNIGLHHIYINPHVKVAYDWFFYYLVNYIYPMFYIDGYEVYMSEASSSSTIDDDNDDDERSNSNFISTLEWRNYL